jgi:3-hydroxybutyryl-CoA dehydratase
VRGDWRAGDEVGRVARTMTAERMRWYCEGLDTAKSETSHPVSAGTNIHTDDTYARAHGLPGRVADGMITTNWLSALLVETFGDAFLRGGSLRTKFIRPVLENDQIEAIVTVTHVDGDATGGSIVHMEVRCQNDRGEPCTVGTASARLQRP